MRRLVLFDIDGTLVLTGGAGVRALNRAFADALGIDDALRGVTLAGRTDRAILEDALERHGRGGLLEDGPASMELRNRYLAYLAEEMNVDGPGKRVLPGVRPLLEALASRSDVALGLLTGNLEEGARIKLAHFGLWEFFPWGAFGDAVDRNALLPVALARARRAGFEARGPASVVVVGDTPHDVACALSGGATAVGVATGPFGEDVLRRSGAHLVLPDLGDTGRVLAAIDAASGAT